MGALIEVLFQKELQINVWHDGVAPALFGPPASSPTTATAEALSSAARVINESGEVVG
jgi:hypothetical protein